MEIRALGGIEIGVANIASADDHGPPIGNPRLVMHAPVDASETQHQLDASMQHVFPRPGGIEQPEFDIRMAVDGVEDTVGNGNAEIVEEQTHAHTAIGGGDDFAHHQPSGQVGIPHVIHEIEAAPRRPGRRHAHRKGIEIGM
ncbi:hypothetical protein D3C72_1589720 [compost metagenome]